MSTVFALYTGHGLLEPLVSIFKEELPDVRIVNVVDDSIIADARAADGVTEQIASRILAYYGIAQAMDVSIILNTCSSVGDVADRAAFFVSTPIVRIDRAMAQAAIAEGSSIGVVATLPTTLDPTIRLVKAEARAVGKDVSIVPVLAAGAYDALVAGNPDDHDRLIREAAVKVADTVDVFVLAQGSMARMEQSLADATGKVVLSSIRLGIRAVGSKLRELGPDPA
jgi:Asp/Glu/hydantoin racemase